MRKVFYKIKCNDFNGNEVERIHMDINEAKKDYNVLKETSGISNVVLLLINETEEELTFDQLPK